MVINILAGLFVGLLVAAPFGPMGVLGFTQAMQKHVRQAWALAVGVCLADATLASIAAFATAFVLLGQYGIELTGFFSILLLIMGIFIGEILIWAVMYKYAGTAG